MNLIPVILAGGSGTRLWPLSRQAYPKQFLSVGSKDSLFQSTLGRLDGLPAQKPLVICNEEHRFLVAEQMRSHNDSGEILLEPAGRNTAPAIALAAHHALLKSGFDEPPVLLILPADHVVADAEGFQKAIERLMPRVEQGCFGTLGVTATFPATGYGYIHAGHELAEDLFAVTRFVEKPDQQTAQRYFEGGDYFWNSGIFMVRADRYLEALADFRPDISQAVQAAVVEEQQDHDFVRVRGEAFAQSPSESIDYAIMEPLTAQGGVRVVVAPIDVGWNDVGSWSAIWELAKKEQHGNAIIQTDQDIDPEVILKDTKNCLIGADNRLITTLGVEDLVIIDTADALLVARKDRVQDVKAVVAEIKKQGRGEHLNHRQVYRPWGKYDSIDQGYRYQVKRITVNPGASLSVQKHHHRAEHWVVVSGTAKVTNGEQQFLVTENQSTYIPVGQVHCLENPGVIPLEMIEVQSGAYLGEDDIVRLKDQYGRC